MKKEKKMKQEKGVDYDSCCRREDGTRRGVLRKYTTTIFTPYKVHLSSPPPSPFASARIAPQETRNPLCRVIFKPEQISTLTHILNCLEHSNEPRALRYPSGLNTTQPLLILQNRITSLCKNGFLTICCK